MSERERARVNVTPEEFRRIQLCVLDAHDDMGRFNEAEFQRLISIAAVGIPPYGRFDVVVRYDVPAVPWLSRGVLRMEPPVKGCEPL